VKLAADLTRFLCETHPDEAARELERLSPDAGAQLLQSIPTGPAAAVLAAMEVGRATDCLSGCSDTGAVDLLTEMTVDTAARVLRRCDPSRRQGWIERMAPKMAATLRSTLDYQEGTAGSLMEPVVVTFPEDTGCGEALRALRRFRQPVRYYVYVTDRRHRLTGVLTLRDLLQAPASQRMTAWTGRPVVCLRVTDSDSVVLRHAGWQSFHALPVVDESGALVGVVGYQTLRRLEASSTREREPSLLLASGILGQAWMSIATVMIDGLAGSLRAIRESKGREETTDG
jgi:magnesium transporter